MLILRLRPLICSLMAVFACLVSAQRYAPISASNVAGLQPAARIDFADLPGELRVGWFEANDSGEEIVLFDSLHQLYAIGEKGIKRSWSYVSGDDQVFALIDAAYYQDAIFILHVLDGKTYINERLLATDYVPAALFVAEETGQAVVEATDQEGRTWFLRIGMNSDEQSLTVLDAALLPTVEHNKPAIRIGRIEFPMVVMSSLGEGEITVYRYPARFTRELGATFALDDGPAVFGAANSSGSHLVWSNPNFSRLNRLNLETGQNQVVTALSGRYVQYQLLTYDASAVVWVNVDFEPVVMAWDLVTGRRHILGNYRDCKRIPDKAALSADGTALIIGCDTGVEIWRVAQDGAG